MILTCICITYMHVCDEYTRVCKCACLNARMYVCSAPIALSCYGDSSSESSSPSNPCSSSPAVPPPRKLHGEKSVCARCLAVRTCQWHSSYAWGHFLHACLKKHRRLEGLLQYCQYTSRPLRRGSSCSWSVRVQRSIARLCVLLDLIQQHFK